MYSIILPMCLWGLLLFPSLLIIFSTSSVQRLTSLRMQWWSFLVQRVDLSQSNIPTVVPNCWWIPCQYFLQGLVCPNSFALWRGDFIGVRSRRGFPRVRSDSHENLTELGEHFGPLASQWFFYELLCLVSCMSIVCSFSHIFWSQRKCMLVLFSLWACLNKNKLNNFDGSAYVT